MRDENFEVLYDFISFVVVIVIVFFLIPQLVCVPYWKTQEDKITKPEMFARLDQTFNKQRIYIKGIILAITYQVGIYQDFCKRFGNQWPLISSL